MVQAVTLSEDRKTWPHETGAVVLSYNLDGSILYTGGFDGFVRVHNPDPSSKEDPKFIEDHDQTITSLDCTFSDLVTACEDGTVKLFDHDSLQFKSLVTRSNIGMAILDARVNRKGNTVAISSDELTVKIVDLNELTKIRVLSGHSKPVRSVSWSPDSSLLVTCGLDGVLKVWDTNHEEPLCTKTINDLIAVHQPDSGYRMDALWHPSGKVFAIATRSHDIALIANDTFITQHTLSSRDAHNSDISALAWSPNGNYLASAGGQDLRVVVWDFATRTPIIAATAPDLVTSLAFRPGPGSNSIAFATSGGILQQWDNVIPGDKAHPSDGPRRGFSSSEQAKKSSKDIDPGLDLDDIDLDLDNDDIDMDDDNAYNDGDHEMDWLEDDTHGGAYTKQLELENTARHRGTGRTIHINKQPPFQPGSTPVRENRKYLAFNMLGFIHSVQREDEHQVVTIEYHDQMSQQGYHWDDHFNFTMSCLGERGSVYAAPAKNGNNSRILYKPARTWASQWQYDLDTGENITCVAMNGFTLNSNQSEDEEEEERINIAIEGSGSVIAGTDKGFVRFFTVSGVQRYIWNLGQEIISIASGKDLALIVTHGAGSGIEDHQQLNFYIIDTDTYELLQFGLLPIPQGTTLKWIGISQDDIPSIYTSDGLLSMMDKSRRPRQGRWIPVLDTTKLAKGDAKNDSYWPVGVTSTQFMCIILKGGEHYPFFPTPLTQEFNLQVPLLNMETQLGQLEESYVRQSLIVSHQKDGLPEPCHDMDRKHEVIAAELELDKCLLKAIQAACKADKFDQVLDLVRSIVHSQSVEAAGKIAGFFHQYGLQERINTIKEQRLENDDEDPSGLKKRKSKYGHLQNDSVIVDSGIEISSGRRFGSNSRDPFAAPFSNSNRAQSSGLTTSNRLPSLSSATLNGASSHEGGMGAIKAVSEEPDPEEEFESISKAFEQTNGRSDSNDGAANGKRPFNPFSKSLAPASNKPKGKGIFGKVVNNEKTGLKKSDSFFSRVDQHANNNKQSQRQTTLLGMKNSSSVSSLNASQSSTKKRKSPEPINDDDGDDAETQTQTQTQTQMETHEELQGNVQEETQLDDDLDETPRSPEWFDDEGNLVEEEEEDIDTQESNKKSRLSSEDGMSKLAQFRNRNSKVGA